MDDDSDDAELWVAADLAASPQTQELSPAAPTAALTAPQQPVPQKLQQPRAQFLDKWPPLKVSESQVRVVQPTPQALPQKSSGATIRVSLRQRGNPLLQSIKSTAWEYSDIPADYVMGLTTCALFLSLKYHRLHPEYIYHRIKGLQGKYSLRVLLALVDITNHEDSLKELAKAALVNNVTLICCWSAVEAARYLELYKSYEHASFKAIQGQQGSSYAEKLVDFVTVLRGVNKSDAVSLVSNFGSLRNAVNADPEQVGIIGGWGEVKVKRWCSAVEEPFRSRKAARRDAPIAPASLKADAAISGLHQAVSVPAVPLREMPRVVHGGNRRSSSASPHQSQTPKSLKDSQPSALTNKPKAREEEELSGGVAAALAKLRQQVDLG